MTKIKNAIKKFTAISMTIVLLSCSLPVSAYAGETFEPEAVSEALEESIPEEVLVNVSEEDNKEVVLVEGFEGDNRENTPDEDSEEDTQDDLLPEPACPDEICNDGNYDSTSSENTCPAMIGDTAYDSIQEAFDAANDGDTVKLCDDITTTETITVNNGAQDMPSLWI